MILEDLMKRLAKAFRTISPESIYFSDFEEGLQNKPMLTVGIVAEGFENMRWMTRIKVAEDVLTMKDPSLKEEYVMAFECYTPKEFKLVKLQRHSLH